MNLIDLINRNDKRLKLEGDWRQVRLQHESHPWRGVEFANGAALTISGISKVRRLETLPDDIGWLVRLRKVSKLSFTMWPKGRAKISLQQDGQEVASREFRFGSSPVPVPMPWNKNHHSLSDSTELHLSFEVPNGYVADLLVHKSLNRDELLRRAVGTGIEIGPGPKPQVHESKTTSVRYLEEMPHEKWVELYDTAGKYGSATADFSNYIIGTADNIPADDNSLDFIFSSHVFEHLANPLGHLVRWREKMASGGVILAVIPEMHSTKDSVAKPSTLDEVQAEFDAGIWKPNEGHYERWLHYRGMDRSPREMMEQNISIHVHFWEKSNLKALLDKAVRDHGFSSYEITHADNHKDFYFCLRK